MYTGDLIDQLISTVQRTEKNPSLPPTRRNSGAPGCYCSSLPAPQACDFCSGIRNLTIEEDEIELERRLRAAGSPLTIDEVIDRIDQGGGR